VDDDSPVTSEAASLVDAVADVVAVFDESGRLIEWNRTLREVTGYTDEALSSLPTTCLFDAPERVVEHVADTLETGETRFDATLVAADGTRFDVEFTATTWAPPGGEGSDGSGAVVCVGRDVTDRTGDRGFTHHRTVLESLPDAVYAIESDGTIVYVNEAYAAMKGVSRGELLGSDVDEWVTDETVDAADDLRAELAHGGRDVAAIEYEFVTGGGERFPAELRFGRVTGGDGDLGRVGTIRDVTDRVERERQLQRQNERLDEFASIVSHDLRNPLNVAEGWLELARSEHDSDQLAAVAGAHDRMRSLVDDLLALARHGRADLDPTAVSLPGLAERCWEAVATPEATLAVETDTTVRAVESQLRRLLENLFRNAVEHGSPDVTVTVGELSDGFFVVDDGPGIPPEQRDVVFDSGFSTSPDGTGFGLRIVREVAEAHGWTVRVVDDADGARFEVRGVAAV